MTTLRRKHQSAPVYMLHAEAAPGTRTRVRGVLWDGVLNATPDDDIDGPSPVEALMAALVGCVTRNVRAVTDSAHVSFDRVTMDVAADRSDKPPAITTLRLDLAITTDVAVERARRLVRLALRDATITRTLARALDLVVRLSINDGPAEIVDVA